MPSATDEQIIALNNRIARLEAEVAELRRGPVRKNPDEVLWAIAESWGGELFSCAELIQFASAQEDPTLKLALSEVFGAGSQARKLGKFLARLKGQEQQGLVVTELASDRHGKIWAVRPASL